MMLRGDGWEVMVRNVISGNEGWRPVLFFVGVLTANGVAVQAWYLTTDGSIDVASNAKFRQVGA